jgi:phosphoglycolate phosphatase
MAPTLVLDLDGTLVDSLPDLNAALNRLMAARGLAPFSLDEMRPMVGDGTPTLIARAFAARQAPQDPGAVQEFVADYIAHVAVATRPYPDAAATLARFADAGWRLAICTNKPEQAARALLDALGIGRFFAAIGGGDSFPVRKPDPAHLLATLREAGGAPDQAVMVGDHANDVKAAHGAGLPCIFARWGYGTAAMAEGAQAVAERFADLPAVAARLLGVTAPPAPATPS